VKAGFVTLRDSVLTAIELAEKAYKTEGHVTGVTSGLIDMDKKLGGFQKSDLLILAGRPSMGKTALAVNFAFNAAKAFAESGGAEGGRVAFFSLEMSADQLATRILSEQSGISGDAIRKGNIRADDFQKFVAASQKMAQVPLYIDDTPALTIGAVRTRARRLKRQHGLDFLIVDYLQLLRGNGSRQSTENRVLEVSEITRGLKAIAKELEIPVLALSQLSRAVEQREDKRPMLSDLRESGSIEQDADCVMFVYREEYYLSRGNSSAIFRNPAWRRDQVRPGIALYGGNPVPEGANPMRPVVRLETRVLQIRAAKAGETVGYGASATLSRDSLLAVVGLGYADGFLRSGSGRASLYWNGKACPALGRVSMDLTAVDITDAGSDGPKVGSWLEVLGESQSVDALAAAQGTISYEVLTSLGPRCRKAYLK
jgi:hypothetical protein